MCATYNCVDGTTLGDAGSALGGAETALGVGSALGGVGSALGVVGSALDEVNSLDGEVSCLGGVESERAESVDAEHTVHAARYFQRQGTLMVGGTLVVPSGRVVDALVIEHTVAAEVSDWHYDCCYHCRDFDIVLPASGQR